jgi:hypothetical protein
MRRVFLALVLASGTALAAAGCSTASTPASTASGPERAISTTPSSSPAPTANGGTSDDDEWNALNSYDGVMTNSFLQLPSSIGDMEQERRKSNPPDLEFHADYVSDIRDAKARLAIYYARTGSGPVPVKSPTDPDFTEIVAGNAQAFHGAGTSRAVDAGGLQWSCFEGSRDDLAHTICVTPAYGRVVEVQYLNAERVDRIALDAFLAGVGEGVAALST